MEFGLTSELDVLRSALHAEPITFEVGPPINSTQEFFFRNDPPTQSQLLKEHRSLIDLLACQNIELRSMRPISGCRFQLFARDVGFVIDNTLYVARMLKSVRQPESESLREVAGNAGWHTTEMDNGSIEGGDVLVAEGTVFVGVGQRTVPSAVAELRARLPRALHLVEVRMAPDILHLDTALSILGHRIVVWYPPALPEGLPRELADYHTIELTSDEAKTLAANMLVLSSQNIVAQQRHQRVNDLLRNVGFQVLTIDLTEITKLGGGPRCCILPTYCCSQDR